MHLNIYIDDHRRSEKPPSHAVEESLEQVPLEVFLGTNGSRMIKDDHRWSNILIMKQHETTQNEACSFIIMHCQGL